MTLKDVFFSRFSIIWSVARTTINRFIRLSPNHRIDWRDGAMLGTSVTSSLGSCLTEHMKNWSSVFSSTIQSEGVTLLCPTFEWEIKDQITLWCWDGGGQEIDCFHFLVFVVLWKGWKKMAGCQTWRRDPPRRDRLRVLYVALWEHEANVKSKINVLLLR